MNYKTSASLLAKGARWGDIECLEEEDILLDLEKRSVEIELAKATRIQFRKAQAVQAQAAQAAQPKPKPQPQYHPKPFRRDFSEPKCLPKCMGCKKFTIHSNPPAHFTEEDKQHCCAYCNTTGGKKHGGSCERNR